MKQTLKILKQLENTPSRNAKIKILEENKHNTKLQTLLKIAFDPFVTLNLKTVKKPKQLKTKFGSVYDDFIKLVSKLEQNNINDQLRKEVQEFLENCIQLQYEIYSKILTKKLRIGLTCKTINKVWNNLITEFDVMLADTKEIDLNQPLYCETKKDGVRLLFIKTKGKTKAYTRKGRVVPLPNITKALDDTPLGEFVLDTEIFYKDRTTTSGLINSALKGTEIDDTVFTVYCFDLLDYKSFIYNNCYAPYKERVRRLHNMLFMLLDYTHYFVKLKGKTTTSEKEVLNFYKNRIKNGEEGIIIKTLDHLYQKKRSKDWIKLKQVNTCTLKIIDIIEGTGKYQNKLGAFVCQDETEQLKVNVGSGFTDIDRDVLFTKDVIGKLVEVKYNELQQDEKGNYYLFLPIFLEIRNDGDLDNLNKIKKEFNSAK